MIAAVRCRRLAALFSFLSASFSSTPFHFDRIAFYSPRFFFFSCLSAFRASLFSNRSFRSSERRGERVSDSDDRSNFSCHNFQRFETIFFCYSRRSAGSGNIVAHQAQRARCSATPKAIWSNCFRSARKINGGSARSLRSATARPLFYAAFDVHADSLWGQNRPKCLTLKMTSC